MRTRSRSRVEASMILAAIDLTTLLVAGIAALGSLGAVISTWRLRHAEGDKTIVESHDIIVKSLSKIIDEQRQHIDWQRDDRKKLGTKIDCITAELTANNGTSLRDAIDRVEKQSARNEQWLQKIDRRVTHLEEADQDLKASRR